MRFGARIVNRVGFSITPSPGGAMSAGSRPTLKLETRHYFRERSLPRLLIPPAPTSTSSLGSLHRAADTRGHNEFGHQKLRITPVEESVSLSVAGRDEVNWRWAEVGRGWGTQMTDSTSTGSAAQTGWTPIPAPPLRAR